MPSPSRNAEINQWLIDQYTEIARLAGGLAHEIKNPLSTIRMNMELLAEDFRDSDAPRDRRALKKVELVERECLRLQDLLDNFLRFSKAHRLNLQPSDLNVQVGQVLDFYRPKASEAGVEIVDYLAGNLPTVLLDREAFHGALLNLVLERRAGDAAGRAIGGPHLRHARRRGLGPDRHRLRHGPRDAGEGFRRLFFHEAGWLRAGSAHHAEDHRGARRPDQLAERTRPGHASDDQAAGPRPPARRRRLLKT